MAGKVQESKRSKLGFRNEEELRKYERELYTKLVNVVGISKEMLRVYGIDYKLFHYYFNSSRAWTPKKDKFVRRVIEMVKQEYPGLHEVIEELEEYLETIREFGKK